jgi:ribosomal protein S18 acetylase RimI-like enzyme
MPQMATDFILRPAQSKDAKQIANLGSHIFASTFGYSMPPSDLDHYLKDAYSISSIESDISNPDVDLIVACDDDDNVIGFSQLRRGSIEPCVAKKEKPIELQRLYVSPEFHGRGIARVLVDSVEKMAKGQGFKTLWLGVWEENVKAQKVYERMGFVRVGEHDFKMGDCVQTDWIMNKNL